MIEINVSGLSCPMPVVKAKEAMDKYPGQTIGVVMDSETAKENVSRMAQTKKYTVSVAVKSDDRFTLLLTPPAK